MQYIELYSFGPIEYCKLTLKEFLVLTGPQASGKSTIAKSIFFFKNIKNLLTEDLAKRGMLNYDIEHLPVKDTFLFTLARCFEQTFGGVQSLNSDMRLRYWYAEGVEIEVRMEDEEILFHLSNGIESFLAKLELGIDNKILFSDSELFQKIKEQIALLFCEDREIIYIPAGRSMLTVLGTQLNYMYSTMDDIQKSSIDYCTRKYIERVIKLKPVFTDGYEGLIKTKVKGVKDSQKVEQLRLSGSLCREILQGTYRYADGDERLQLENRQYVKINFASSGQQEAVWILNVLFYYMLIDKKAYFIIEEPESHLFPDAQKLITELISIVQNNENQVLVTTHSPYVLGELNNLLYANKIAGQVECEELDGIIHPLKRLDFQRFSACYMEQGELCPCVDEEFKSIENEVIDGASEKINKEYEEMIRLVHEAREGAEENASNKRAFFV